MSERLLNELCVCVCDDSSRDLCFQIHRVSAAESDTYKCCAVNEFGKAVCTTTLTLTDGRCFWLFFKSCVSTKTCIKSHQWLRSTFGQLIYLTLNQ